MGEVLRHILLIIALIFCCAYPYSFNKKYMNKYGEKCISYPIAIISGASGLWFSLVYENQESTAYFIALVLLVISVVLNLYKIVNECRKENIDTADKVRIAICQVLFAFGIFGIFVVILGTLYLAGGGGKKKKRKK
jgi:hypothetical protein